MTLRVRRLGRPCSFPACVPHEVTENAVDADRIGVGFTIAGGVAPAI
jgi:hypothetical protein